MITDIFIPRFYMLKCLSTSYFYYKWFPIEIKGISLLTASSVIIQRRCTSLVFFYLQICPKNSNFQLSLWLFQRIQTILYNSFCFDFFIYKKVSFYHSIIIIQRKQTHVHILVRLHTPKQIGFLIFFFFTFYT